MIEIEGSVVGDCVLEQDTDDLTLINGMALN